MVKDFYEQEMEKNIQAVEKTKKEISTLSFLRGFGYGLYCLFFYLAFEEDPLPLMQIEGFIKTAVLYLASGILFVILVYLLLYAFYKSDPKKYKKPILLPIRSWLVLFTVWGTICILLSVGDKLFSTAAGRILAGVVVVVGCMISYCESRVEIVKDNLRALETTKTQWEIEKIRKQEKAKAIGNGK